MCMKKHLQITIYSILYLILPISLLLFAQKKYPAIVTWNLIIVSGIYLATIFSLSVVQIFMRWKSLPSIGIFIATVLYMNFVISDIRISYQRTVIHVNLSNTLILLYAILALKTVILIYGDLKKEVNQESVERHHGSRYLLHQP